MVTEIFELEIAENKRTNLSKIVDNKKYLIEKHEDGTLIWKPAVTISKAQLDFLQDTELQNLIEHSYNTPQKHPRPKRT